MVKKALESKFIQSLCMILYKRQLKLVEDNSSTITTNLYTSASGASQLLGIGIKSSITGKHADLVITDDICNIKDRISKAERDLIKIQYQELQNIKNRGGRIINLGTKWHKDDVFTMMDNIHVFDYHKTGLISDEQLAKIKESMTASLFACNYELRIIAAEDVIFLEPETGGNPAMCEQGMAHVDAAFGGEDYTAFTIMRKKEGKYYVLGKLWHKHVENCYDEIKQYYQRFMCGKLPIEDNGDKGFTARDLKKMGLRAYTYHESMNKHIKITTYLLAIWKDVIFVDGTDDEYIEQICDYNEDAEHDDAPDSAASLARELYNKNEAVYKPLWN
jgi:predicted phage terminase large subunit-like protein